jgi:hypothetical protein
LGDGQALATCDDIEALALDDGVRATGTDGLDDWPGSGRDGLGDLIEAAGRSGRWRDGDAGGRAGNAGEGAEVAGLLESGRGTAAVDADKDGDDAEVQKHDGTDG